MLHVAGFDYSSQYDTEPTTSNVLSTAQAVRSVTGEFCQSDGSYSQERPTGDAIPTNGGNCTVLTSLVCVRCVISRVTMWLCVHARMWGWGCLKACAGSKTLASWLSHTCRDAVSMQAAARSAWGNLEAKSMDTAPVPAPELEVPPLSVEAAVHGADGKGR